MTYWRTVSFFAALGCVAAYGWWIGTFDPAHFRLPAGMLLLCGWGTRIHAEVTA